MTDTNYLRDALKDAAQGPLDSCTLCGAIINRSYEEAHNHFHQAFHQTAYQPLASHAPDATVQTCKICGILINRSTKTRTAAVTGSCRRSARRR